MRNRLIFIGVVLNFIFLTGCNNDDQTVNIDSNLAGTWKYITPEKVDKINCTDDPSFNCNSIIVAEIDFSVPDNNGKGNYSGNIWANRFEGNYTLGTNNSITLNHFITTEICEPFGSEFHSIGDAKNYEIKGDILTIFYNQNDDSITLVR